MIQAGGKVFPDTFFLPLFPIRRGEEKQQRKDSAKLSLIFPDEAFDI